VEPGVDVYEILFEWLLPSTIADGIEDWSTLDDDVEDGCGGLDLKCT
jgi:hypothetical protein